MALNPGVRRRRINNCRRKVAYETLADAKAAAKLVRKLIKEMIVYYQCPHNRTHFHIGHPDKKPGRDKAIRSENVSKKCSEKIPREAET